MNDLASPPVEIILEEAGFEYLSEDTPPKMLLELLGSVKIQARDLDDLTRGVLREAVVSKLKAVGITRPGQMADDALKPARSANVLEGAKHLGKPFTFREPDDPVDGVVAGRVQEFQNLTDLGNARRFAQRHGRDVSYVRQWGWVVWDGTRHRLDTRGEVQRLAKETVGSIYGESSRLEDSRREAVAQHAIRSEAKSRIQAMIDLAWSEPGIVASPDDFDKDPWLFNCQNGTIELRTGTLREHRREDLITKLSPTHFEEHVGGEVFMRFLDRIMEGKPQVANYLRRLIGYSLTGLTVEQILLILYGQGSNGKTTLLEVIGEMMGDYAQHTPASTFMVQRGERIPNDIARLQGARLVVATETEEAKRLSESLVKSLTGGDSVAARFLHKEFFEFKPQFTPFLATNHRPTIKGVDHAIWRRLKLIPFTITIPDDEQDKELPEKLRQEMPAILSWAVMGCLEWQRDGLKEPKEVSVSTDTYRSEMDVLGEFFEECCAIDKTAEALARDIFQAYKEWCLHCGEKVFSQRWLGLRLSERGFGRKSASGGFSKWTGIGLKVNKFN